MWWREINADACGCSSSRIADNDVFGSARSPISAIDEPAVTLNKGCSPSHNMWLARRMANGPNREPGRFVVAPSHAIPATTVSASGLPASGGALKKPGLDVDVRNAN
jgi:hypothetical protein